MDARLEAALLDVLERTGRGRPPDEAWLRAAHPTQWREILAFLAFESRLRGGGPGGAAIGPYVLLRRLGRGGAGTVFLAETHGAVDGIPPGATVAVKVLHPHLAERPGFVEAALAEARAAAAIEHPNLVRTLDAGVADGPQGPVAYVVTEHVEGQNLRGLLDELGPLAEPLVRHLAREILRALAAVHAAGAVHGDLKPENVLVGPDESVKVVDVGFAPRRDDAEFRGTVLYAAPEQFPPMRGSIDGRADLYALGVLVEELLSGSHPLAQSSPARPGRAPSAFLRTFAATLRAPLPEDRFATSDAALAVLDAGEESAWWRARARNEAAEPAPAAWSAPGARSTSLHGRIREMDRLVAILDETRSGAGRVVLVTGDAGVGKTRLLREFAAAAHAAGARVVWCAHDVTASGDPFAAALRAAVDAGDIDLAAHAPAAEELEAALAAWVLGRAAAHDVAPLSVPARTVAVGALLRSIAVRRPLLVVADDLHLAADEDRAFLGSLVTEVADATALVVVAARPLHAETSREALPHAISIDLANLSVEGVGSMLSEALHSETAADLLAPEVHRRTGGIPLAVLEHLDALRDADLLVRDEHGAWTPREGALLPAERSSARAMLTRRLAALSRADRDLLEVAACEGPRFHPSLVAGALGRDPGRVLLRLARIERRDRLVRTVGDDIAFEHHEVRDALLDALPEERSRAYHAALGAALESACSARGGASPRESAAIARHHLRGGAGARAAPHVAAALPWLEKSDRPTELILLSREALATPDAVDAAASVGVLIRLSQCCEVVGRADESLPTTQTAVATARRLGDRALVRSAVTELCRSLTVCGQFDEALHQGHAMLDEAVAAGDLLGEELASAALGGTYWYQMRREESARHMRRQFELAGACGDPAREGEAETHLAVALASLGRIEEALGHFASSLAKLRTAGAEASLVCATLEIYADTLARAGRRDESVTLFEEMARFARVVGNVRSEAAARSELGWQLRLVGRPDEALVQLERAVELAVRSRVAMSASGVRRYLAVHLDSQGRTAEALAVCAKALEVARAHGFVRGAVQCLTLISSIEARLGDFARARASAAAAADAAGVSGSEVMSALAALGKARWVHPGGRSDAPALEAVLAELRRLGHTDVAAHVLIELAVLDLEERRESQAVARFTEARQASAALGWPALVTLCDARLARLGHGDAAEVVLRAVAKWSCLSVWGRIEVAGLLGDAALIDRARADVETAVACAPPDHRGALRERLERMLVGPGG